MQPYNKRSLSSLPDPTPVNPPKARGSFQPPPPPAGL